MNNNIGAGVLPMDDLVEYISRRIDAINRDLTELKKPDYSKDRDAYWLRVRKNAEMIKTLSDALLNEVNKHI